MLAKKHIAIQYWLCGLLVAIAVTGSSLCARAGRLQKVGVQGMYQQLAQGHYISQDKELPRGVHRSVFVSNNDEAHVSPRFKVKAAGPVALHAGNITIQASGLFRNVVVERIGSYSCLLRPGY